MAVPGRGNGLRADAYVPLADLDPRLADAMLELLRDSGVAAYAVPVGSEVSGHFGTRMPERPTDRLYVDAGNTETARAVLDAYLPSTDVDRPEHSADIRQDEEEAWREIVAGYNSVPPDPVPPWPASEDVDDEPAGGKTGIGGREPEAAPVPPRQGAREAEAAENSDDEEHFVPPPPPPLPHPEPITAGAWACLFGGPTYLLVATVVGWSIPGWAAFLAVAAFIGGFVTLVLRMGDHPPPDSGPDDGAIV